jgi:hypothetical protein
MHRFSVVFRLTWICVLPLLFGACDAGGMTAPEPGRLAQDQAPAQPPTSPPAAQQPPPPAERLCDQWGNLDEPDQVLVEVAFNRFGEGKHFYLHIFGPARAMFLIHIREGRPPFEAGMVPGRYAVTRRMPSDCGLCINASVGAKVDASDLDSAWLGDTFYMAVGGTFTIAAVNGGTQITLEDIRFNQLNVGQSGFSYVNTNPCSAKLERVTYRIPQFSSAAAKAASAAPR